MSGFKQLQICKARLSRCRGTQRTGGKSQLSAAIGTILTLPDETSVDIQFEIISVSDDEQRIFLSDGKNSATISLFNEIKIIGTGCLSRIMTPEEKLIKTIDLKIVVLVSLKAEEHARITARKQRNINLRRRVAYE